MNQFIYVLSLRGPFRKKENWTEKENTIVSEHFNHLLKLKDEGILILAGKTRYDVDNDENFGIVVFQADSESKAREIMESDPAIIHQVMTAELHPFNLAVIKD